MKKTEKKIIKKCFYHKKTVLKKNNFNKSEIFIPLIIFWVIIILINRSNILFLLDFINDDFFLSFIIFNFIIR